MRLTPRCGSALALVTLAAVLVSATASAGTGTSTLPFIQQAPGEPGFSEQTTSYAPTQTTRTIPFWTGRFNVAYELVPLN